MCLRSFVYSCSCGRSLRQSDRTKDILTKTNKTMKYLIEKKDLLNGTHYYFDNESYQENIENDDIRGAEVHYLQHGSVNRFVIWFNGGIIYSCETFPPLVKRLDKLINKWHLELTDITN